MNNQNEHPTNIPPEQDKGEKPGLFSIIFCYILSIGCFLFAILGIVSNLRMNATNSAYGSPSSAGQLGYDIIGFLIGEFLPVILAIIFGIVFFRAAKKDHEARKEWDYYNK